VEYLLLIYANEAEATELDPAKMAAMVDEFRSFTQSIVKSGNHKGRNRLRPTSTATTVRVRDGKTLTTDGPFAGPREQLSCPHRGGDLDEAIRIAAHSARGGAAWSRPVWTMT
jgi:hypothetical protein